MNDLVTWLRGQLDEDERVAKATHDSGWVVEEFRPSTPDALPGNAWIVDATDTDAGIAVVNGSYRAVHMTRHDPARVLAEVEAKRWIIDLHRCDDEGGLDPICNVCLYMPPCETIRALTLPYADRPGFKEEWRII